MAVIPPIFSRGQGLSTTYPSGVAGKSTSSRHNHKAQAINDDYGTWQIKKRDVDMVFDDYYSVSLNFDDRSKYEKYVPDFFQYSLELETMEQRIEKIEYLGEQYRHKMQLLGQFALQWDTLIRDIAEDESLKELFDEFMVIRRLKRSGVYTHG